MTNIRILNYFIIHFLYLFSLLLNCLTERLLTFQQLDSALSASFIASSTNIVKEYMYLILCQENSAHGFHGRKLSTKMLKLSAVFWIVYAAQKIAQGGSKVVVQESLKVLFLFDRSFSW